MNLATQGVEMVRQKERECGYTLRFYDVRIKGQSVGHIERVRWHAERRIPGKRYVAARWEAKSPRWEGHTQGRRWEADTREQALRYVLGWLSRVSLT